MTRLTLIAGVARGGALGRDNELLVRIPQDMARFKALTLGHTVIMGRKTWDSIPQRFRPLVERRNLVLSRQPGLRLPGAEVFASLAEAVAACRTDDAPVFVMGGAQVYAQALPLAERLELTEIDADFDADCFFPAWDRQAFDCTARESHLSAQGWRYDFASYQRKT